MTTKQILSLTLLATTLTLSAAAPREYPKTIKQQANSLSHEISSILYNRGIEQERAKALSDALLHPNEPLFSMMLHNYIYSTKISKEEVLEYLSREALKKKSVDLSSYATLIKISQQIEKVAPTQQTLAKLEEISSKNALLVKVFS